jgi:hypothetical protein
VTVIRLYVDEDASETAVVVGLRVRGLDVVTAQEAGRLTLSDPEQLAFAAQQRRVLYTFNVRDYARLHVEFLVAGQDHHGIFAIPDQRISIGEKIRRVRSRASAFSAEDMINRLEFL